MKKVIPKYQINFDSNCLKVHKRMKYVLIRKSLTSWKLLDSGDEPKTLL